MRAVVWRALTGVESMVMVLVWGIAGCEETVKVTGILKEVLVVGGLGCGAEEPIFCMHFSGV